MRWIPTPAHAVLDYLSVVTLLALPRFLNWDANVTNILTIVAITTLVYTLLTRFEGGLLRVLPTKVHLLLDLVSGLGLASLPFWLLADADSTIKAILTGFGLFEVVVSVMTRSRSGVETAGHTSGNSPASHAAV